MFAEINRHAGNPNGPRVALLIESSRAFGRGLLLGVAQYVREHGPWSIFLQERSLADPRPGWLPLWKGEGIIARVENRLMADTILQLGLPVVDLRYVVPDVILPSVRTKDETIGRLAAGHFLERGFRNFAYCGFHGVEYSDIRQVTFEKCVRQAGFRCRVFKDPQEPDNSGTLEYEEHGLIFGDRVAAWLQDLPKPVGLMACNDIRGQQVLNACRSIQAAVPDEVAVIGVDNDEVLCNLSEPPLSSVMPNCERIGYEAAALLDKLMAGEQPPRHPVMVEPAGIVTRRSTEVLAIEDIQVAKVARFIREHCCEGIDVGDLLKVAPLSRSGLERRFIKALGRSPKEEILRIRLDRAKRLLSETEMPLAVIAEKIGCEHTEYFNVIFKKKTGMTPGQFRTGSKADNVAGRILNSQLTKKLNLFP